MSSETLQERSKKAVKASKENIDLIEQLVKEHNVMVEKLDIREPVPDFIANDLTDVRTRIRELGNNSTDLNAGINYVIMKLYSVLNVKDSKEFLPDTRAWLKRNGNAEKFMRGIINGFYVPPQKYYLRHIWMSDFDKEYDYYALHRRDGGITHAQTYKGQLPDWDDSFEFTEQEISDANTGSYEEIELEVDYD